MNKRVEAKDDEKEENRRKNKGEEGRNRKSGRLAVY